MDGIGKILIAVGLLTAFLGLLISFIARFANIGRLPGDIYLQKGNFTFFFPITTSILLSIILTLLLSLFFRR